MNTRILAAAGLGALLLAVSAGLQAGSSGGTLVIEVEPGLVVSVAGRAEVEQAARIVDASIPAIRNASRLELTVFGQSMHMERERIDERATGWTWQGPVGGGCGWAQFVLESGRLAGYVQPCARRPDLSITPLRDGGSAFVIIDPARLPAEAAPVVPELAPGDRTDSDSAGKSLGSHVKPAAGSAVVQIDVLAAYTAAAAAQHGGAAGLAALARANVEWINQAFANGGLALEFKLVAVKPLLLEEPDNGGWSALLNQFKDDPQAKSLRDQYGADLMALYAYQQTPSICGIGYVMRYPGPNFSELGYSITLTQCSPSTFAHETGHNMGLEHDPDNGPDPANASYPYAFGYGFVAKEENRAVRTIMAYRSVCEGRPCTRFWGFSSPRSEQWGQPMGTEKRNYNVMALSNTKAIVAAFRERPPWLFDDRFEEAAR